MTTGTALTRAATSAIAAFVAASSTLPDLVVMSSISDATAASGNFVSSVFSARPDSPLNWSALVSLLLEIIPPPTDDSATKSSHPTRTVFL